MHNENTLLERIITERILRQGPLTVAEYMTLALAHPGHGYYMKKDPFGRTGDFITAPEISQMFGEMIAVWFTDIWLQSGKPDTVNLVELGPGRGTLAADILRTMSTWPDLKGAVTAHLVEISPALQAKQKETLQGQRVVWHESIDSLPDGFCLVVANEFFDALPIHQFEKRNGRWQEKCIGYDEKEMALHFVLQPSDIELERFMPEAFLNAPEGSIFEISPASLTVADTLARRIAGQGGAAIFFDYGHSKPGLGDTLQAVSHHSYADPLKRAGQCDITAHVDFATLGVVASQHVNVHGPVTQGTFLADLGIAARAEKLCSRATPERRAHIMAAMQRLIAPQGMGELFKVMAFTTKSSIINVAGFGASADEIPDNQS